MASAITPESKIIGQRIHDRRLLLRMSLRACAERADLHHTALGRIERGERSAANRFVLARIAAALRCEVADLTGKKEAPANSAGARAAAAANAVARAALAADLEYPPFTYDGAARPAAAWLTREADLVADLRRRCDYLGAARRLPDLLTHAHAVASAPHDADERAAALTALVVACESASFVVRYLGAPPSSAILADRARQAARELGDPVLGGLATFAVAHAALGCGLYERGQLVAERGLSDLAAAGQAAGADEMRGMLLLTAAYAQFGHGDHELAADTVAEASVIADRTGDTDTLGLMFGPTNIRFWQVSMLADGDDPGAAVAIAAATRPELVDSTSRRAAFHIDAARAVAAASRVRDADAVRHLATAERIAPQRVVTDPLVRETARALLDRSRRAAAGTELRGLCQRIGVGA